MHSVIGQRCGGQSRAGDTLRGERREPTGYREIGVWRQVGDNSGNGNSRYAAAMRPDPRLEIHPLTAPRFRDLETLFNGPGGSQVRGCWCMFYRRSGPTAIPKGMSQPEHARCSLKALVEAGTVPGLIGYRDGEPVGWVSLGPREARLIDIAADNSALREPVQTVAPGDRL